MKIRNFDFFNLFYSFGAAIVLLGALFKVLDTTYADYIFITGLVVEILVFLVSAFLFSKKQKELSWEKVFPELVSESGEPIQSENPANQSVMSLGNNMQELSQNLGDIANSFKQMRNTINNLDSSVSQLENANSGYKEEMQALKKNLADINDYYSDFITALSSKTKRD
ncbi:gliding motility protein GldL [Ferruginibacter lapsinanis]|uniref:type IX secretion system motor protein PorL/GldL n=1 Tax=Ferruginibacter lapsinanis TaxID=563172 RepID=UPI001E28C553|nr:gliding motility protein GldL [Ferruginibacter lapsinanis]UEG49745.1 gliding motility protein GldL [Ferruginibacter lapsinanis]